MTVPLSSLFTSPFLRDAFARGERHMMAELFNDVVPKPVTPNADLSRSFGAA